MEKQEIKKVAQELFEQMDFGNNVVVDVDKWDIYLAEVCNSDFITTAELSIMVDEVDDQDSPSVPCVVTVLFDIKKGKAIQASSENEFGETNGTVNVDAYYAKIEADKLQAELDSKKEFSPKKLKL